MSYHGLRGTRLSAVAVLLVLVGSLLAMPAARADTGTAVSRVVVLSDTTTPVKTWSAYPVRVRVEAADGTPLPGRSVTVWDDSYVRWRCCGPPPSYTTDAYGEVSTVLNLDGNSANPVKVAAFWHGDATYAKAIAEWYQPLVGYTTSLDVASPTAVTSGDAIPVTVSVQRTDPDAGTRGCLSGTVVQLDLAGPSPMTTSATVSYDAGTRVCGATVNLPTSLTPGSYTLTASTGHDGWSRTDEPWTVVRPLSIGWQYAFTDGSGRGRVLLSVAAQEYRVVLTDGHDSGARFVGSDISKTGVTVSGVYGVAAWRIDLNHQPSGADGATGAFYSTGSFSASGSFDGTAWSLSA
jgi:hypothetical protein